MDLTKLSKLELLTKCEELGITRCKSKNKSELITLINEKELVPSNETVAIEEINEIKLDEHDTDQSKYTLVDLFCGTGAFTLSIVFCAFTLAVGII